jgi:hypothetical protein
MRERTRARFSFVEYMKKWIPVIVATALILSASAVLAQTTTAKVEWPSMQKLLDSAKSGEPLAHAALSASELKAVQAALARMARGQICQDSNIQSCAALQSIVLEKVQITIGGQKAVILRSTSDCGTAGCRLWIVDVAQGGSMLLEDFGWGYAILPTHERGYFDVVTAGGNHEIDLTMWRFKGAHYRLFRCASTGTNPGTDSEAGGQILEHPCRSSTP